MEGKEQQPDMSTGLEAEPMMMPTTPKEQGVITEQNLGSFEIKKDDNKQGESLLHIDRNGNLFSNFFSNFYRQLKNPTRFSFFNLELYTPIREESEPLLTQYNNTLKNQITMENTTNTETEYRYSPEQIDWKSMEKLGLNREKLEQLNALDPLLKGFKTNTLIPITIQLGSAVSKMDVRLSLQPSDTNSVSVHLHAIRREPNLNLKFLGHEFTDEDKRNLMEQGNMGRVVNLVNPKTDEIIPSVISRDRLTNELVAYRAEYMKVPDEIKGIRLDDYQKQTLLEGRPLYLEGMTSKKGDPFDANVQFNADKRYVEFIFNNNQKQQQSQSQKENVPQNQNKNTTGEAPRVFRDKELDDKEYEKFKAGETVYVSGLTDSKGKEYQGYITFNKETSKTEFSFTNPNKLKEKAEPSEDHKTQTAVNSGGKTNEATKNIMEPLKTGQQKPENKEQQEQQQKPTRSRGRKM